MTFQTRDKLTGTPTVTIMVGFSRSGKSTYVNKQHQIIVSRDDIRRAMGQEFNILTEPLVKFISETMLRAAISRGQSVIVDETHLTKESRQSIINICRDTGADYGIVHISPPIDMAKWKENCRKDNFPWKVIGQQLAEYEYLSEEEISGARFVSYLPRMY